MKKFVSRDCFNIPGRGLVFTTKAEDRSDWPKINEIVMVDDKRYRVCGIEASRNNFNEASKNIGLNVVGMPE